MFSAGAASTSRITTAPTATGHGRRDTKPLQRAAKPLSRSAKLASPWLSGTLIRRPIRVPRIAGISVSDANIVNATASAAPMAGP